MVTSKELPPLPAIGAKLLETKIELLADEAFADAALHDPTGEIDLKQHDFDASHVDDVLADPKEKQRAVKDMTLFASLQFGDTPEDQFITAAFDSLKAIVRARTMEETKPGQRDFFVQEAIDKADDAQKLLAEKIEKNDLPPENMASFTEAYALATTPTISPEWANIEARRAKQGFRSK